MDEKIKNDEKNVMLVRDAGKNGKIEAVSQIDENGNIQTVAAASSNLANLFNVYTNDSAIEAFLKKFIEEMQAPVKTGISDIFIMPVAVLEKLFKVDLDPLLMEHYRVDPAAELSRIEQLRDEGQRFQPMDISKIDRADMERKGIRMEDLEPHLRAMSYGHKSHGLIEMYPEMESGGMRVTTKGRVSLEEQPDGSLKVIPHYYREKCDLDAPFHGVLLDEETKRNITETRHAGKVLELELEEGKLTPCFVSRDKWTNELVAMPVSEIERFSRLKNVDLSEGKQIDLFSGRKVLLEGYTTRSGYKRDAYIQIDASERNIEFDHSGLDRKRYQEQNRGIYPITFVREFCAYRASARWRCGAGSMPCASGSNPMPWPATASFRATSRACSRSRTSRQASAPWEKTRMAYSSTRCVIPDGSNRWANSKTLCWSRSGAARSCA